MHSLSLGWAEESLEVEAPEIGGRVNESEEEDERCRLEVE
jgi:hypothetical protein